MRIARATTWIVSRPRAVPYLGPLGAKEVPNARGYVVRQGNATIYPLVDRSVVVALEDEAGRVGLGETYGICSPRATCEILNDLLVPVLASMEVTDIGAANDTLYDLMRVRGAAGGFYGEALAAIDIALWDLAGQARGVPVARLLADAPQCRVAAYLSGLPAATMAERVTLACDWQARGIDAFKFAGVVAHEGIAEELAALRAALGPAAELMVDLHWKFAAEEALALLDRLAPHAPAFAEAPLKPEDHAGLRRLAASAPVPLAIGEEWHNEHEAAAAIAAAGGRLAFLQPEMARTGITRFQRIAALSRSCGAQLAPHATIGCGIFLAASLHASAAADNLWRHEWQHSVFAHNRDLLDGALDFSGGAYDVPTGSGLGVTLSDAFHEAAERVE